MWLSDHLNHLCHIDKKVIDRIAMVGTLKKLTSNSSRDVLMWAEYPNQMHVQSWKEPAEKVRKARQDDEKQYLDWLNK